MKVSGGREGLMSSQKHGYVFRCEYLNQCFHTLESISLILWIMHSLSTAPAANTVCYAVILHTCQSHFSVLSQCCGQLKKKGDGMWELILYWKREVNSILNKTLRVKCSFMDVGTMGKKKKILSFLYLCKITNKMPKKKIFVIKTGI